MKSRHPFRTAKALMVLKGLSLGQVARKAGMNYTVACEILNGTRRDPERLRRLRTAIEQLQEVPA